MKQFELVHMQEDGNDVASSLFRGVNQCSVFVQVRSGRGQRRMSSRKWKLEGLPGSTGGIIGGGETRAA